MTKPGGSHRRRPASERDTSWTWAPPARTDRQLRRELEARRLQAALRRSAKERIPPEDDTGVAS